MTINDPALAEIKDRMMRLSTENKVRCTAVNKATNEQCKKKAVAGGLLCCSHGGKPSTTINDTTLDHWFWGTCNR